MIGKTQAALVKEIQAELQRLQSVVSKLGDLLKKIKFTA